MKNKECSMYKESESYVILDVNGVEYYAYSSHYNSYKNNTKSRINIYGLDGLYKGSTDENDDITYVKTPLACLTTLPKSYMKCKLINDDTIYLYTKYFYDRDKITLYDINTKECINNEYRENIEYQIRPKHVALNIKGGAKNRIYLGAINDKTLVKDNRVIGTNFNIKMGSVITRVAPYWRRQTSTRMSIYSELHSVLLVNSEDEYHNLVETYGQYQRISMDGDLEKSLKDTAKQVYQMASPHAIIQSLVNAGHATKIG